MFQSKRTAFIADISEAIQKRRIPDHLLLTLARKANQLCAFEIARKLIALHLESSSFSVMKICEAASLLAELGAVREAVGVLEPLECDGYVEVTYLLGVLELQLGNRDRSQHLLKELLSLNPLLAQGWLMLSQQINFRENESMMRVLVDAASRIEEMGPFSRAQFSSAIAKAYFDLEEYAKGFQFLKEGNEIFYRSLKPSGDLWRSHHQKWLKIQEEMKGTRPANFETDGGPIFILGLPRSGTTLLEQMLASHPQIGEGGEFHGFTAVCPDAEVEGNLGSLIGDRRSAFRRRIATEYLQAHAERFASAGKIILDKTLSHSIRAGFIAEVLPNARFVLIKRDPLHTAWSCFKTCFSDGHHWSFNLFETAGYFKFTETLIDGWRNHLGERLFELNYQELVDTPERTLGELVKFLNLPESEAMIRFHEHKRVISTASLNQVNRPLFKSDSKELETIKPSLTDFINAYFK